jgi:hypothetical protein
MKVDVSIACHEYKTAVWIAYRLWVEIEINWKDIYCPSIKIHVLANTRNNSKQKWYSFQIELQKHGPLIYFIWHMENSFQPKTLENHEI